MIFTNAIYLLFFTVFFIIYNFVLKMRDHRINGLIVGSLVFYSYGEPRYIFLLLFTALWDFSCAHFLASFQGYRRKILLILSLTLNIGLLINFKSIFNIDNSIILPMGLSFYTFQSMAYVIDVYRERIPLENSFRIYLASITFFPHLVAGPLLRPQDIFNQFKTDIEFTWQDSSWGLWLIGAGLLKKNLADILAPGVDAVFETGSVLPALPGVLGFVGQIYGDFSGYTDIALGSALLLGIHLPLNFKTPFSATSVLDYYGNHWHLSLGRWIREYLFTPLSLFLQRRFSQGLFLAILLTMSIMGLWHGFRVTFLVWGLLIGACLVLNHYWRKMRLAETLKKYRIWHFISWAVTFYVIALTLTIFRSHSLGQSLTILRNAHQEGWDESTIKKIVLIGLTISTLHLLSLLTNLKKLPKGFVFILTLVLFFSLAFTFSGPEQGFIYFQF